MRNPNKSCLHLNEIIPSYLTFLKPISVTFFPLLLRLRAAWGVKEKFSCIQSRLEVKGVSLLFCDILAGISCRHAQAYKEGDRAYSEGGRKRKKRCEDGAFTAAKCSLNSSGFQVLASQTQNCP